jgi:hypothetical protein
LDITNSALVMKESKISRRDSFLITSGEELGEGLKLWRNITTVILMLQSMPDTPLRLIALDNANPCHHRVTNSDQQELVKKRILLRVILGFDGIILSGKVH